MEAFFHGTGRPKKDIKEINDINRASLESVSPFWKAFMEEGEIEEAFTGFLNEFRKPWEPKEGKWGIVPIKCACGKPILAVRNGLKIRMADVGFECNCGSTGVLNEIFTVPGGEAKGLTLEQIEKALIMP